MITNQYDYITKSYLDGLSIHAIRVKYLHSDKFIKKILIQEGIYKEPRKIFTNDEISKIIDDYKSGNSVTNIRKNLNADINKLRAF